MTQEKQEEQAVVARLLIFSGRPDPELALDDDAVNQLRERVQSTVNGEKSNPAPAGGLGYRGFLVQNLAKVSGLPAEFSVFRGVLSELSERTGSHWRDIGETESWLLELARGQGLGDALDAFGARPGQTS